MTSRILHFTKNELFWECAALIAPETAPNGLTLRRLRNDFHIETAKPTISQQRLDVNTFLQAGLSREEFLSFWLRLVEDFMSRSLTYYIDKLIVLSGVTQAISEQTQAGLRYWAGAWNVGVLEGLYLIPKHAVYESGHLSTRYGSCVAPSWSWAPVDGEVVFGPQPCRYSTSEIDQKKINQLPLIPALTVMDGRIEPYGADPYGQIHSGSLMVAGVLSRGLSVEAQMWGCTRSNYCFFHTHTPEDVLEFYELRYDEIPPMMLVEDPEKVRHASPRPAANPYIACVSTITR